PAPIVAATVAAARRKQTEMITIWLSLFAPALGRCHLPRGRARVQPWTLLSRGVPGARSSCLLFGGRRGARGYGAFLRDCPSREDVLVTRASRPSSQPRISSGRRDGARDRCA